MALTSFDNINIKAIAACVPKHVSSNIDHPFLFSDKEKTKLIKITGIKERRIAPPEICASDLAYEAALNLINKTKINKEEIKCLIFLSQTPDYRIPFTSNILQNRLNLTNDCTCIDINAGCNGFISGLQTAYSIQRSLNEGHVLFLVGETMSKILSPMDRATSLIFGDGAAALLLEQSRNTFSWIANYSDGSSFDVINIKDSGFRNPVSSESLEYQKYDDGSERSNNQLFMDGTAVFDFTMREVIPSFKKINDLARISNDDIDYYVFHQSNRFIINQFISQLDLPKDKVLINIDRFGNTSGVSIPLTIVTELAQQTDFTGTLHCNGYGAGLSWGNAIVNLNNTTIIPLIEI